MSKGSGNPLRVRTFQRKKLNLKSNQILNCIIFFDGDAVVDVCVTFLKPHPSLGIV